MTLQPLADYVVLKPCVAEGKTKGGIVLPDVAQKQVTRGEVLAVGPGKYAENTTIDAERAGYLALYRKPLAVKPGDVVHFVRYGGIEIEQAGEKYLLVKEDELVAVERK